MATAYCFEHTPRTTTTTAAIAALVPATQYQLEKFIKHTAPTGVYPVNGVFDTNDYAKYRDYMVSAQASGCLLVDDNGRNNFIFFAGEQTGLQYREGVYEMPASGATLVLGHDAAKFHAFPSTQTPNTLRCSVCGKPVPSYPTSCE